MTVVAFADRKQESALKTMYGTFYTSAVSDTGNCPTPSIHYALFLRNFPRFLSPTLANLCCFVEDKVFIDLFSFFKFYLKSINI